MVLCFVVLSLFFLIAHFRSPSTESTTVPVGTSGVVIVTVFDRAVFSENYTQRIKKNRGDYAKRHGTECGFPIIVAIKLTRALLYKRLHEFLH